ncbi:MAG: hypothetical protein M4579_002321 [Chaenotheca gracillima]|nr:MAG: hypothetical protein M4579_002321 [Chaenotheca gracillima]
MGSEFIGLTVLVTLKTPAGTQLQGRVEEVSAEHLILRDVVVPRSGHRMPEYHIAGAQIEDLEVAEDQKPPQSEPWLPPVQQPVPRAPIQQAPQPELAPQKKEQFTDPAILSVGPKPTYAAQGSFQRPTQPVAHEILTEAPPRAAAAPIQVQTLPRPGHGIPAQRGVAQVTAASPAQYVETPTAATLTGPFMEMAFNGDAAGLENGELVEQANGESSIGKEGKTGKRARTRRGGRLKTRKDAAIQTPSSYDAPAEQIGSMPSAIKKKDSEDPAGTAWRGSALLEDRRDLGPGSGRSGPSSTRKSRRSRPTKIDNYDGWATEEATDIQGMGEFDFAGNLSKFDKKSVFSQIRADDTTADESRLVSFNRLQPKGKNADGGPNKKLPHTENVLDPRDQMVKWNSEAGNSTEDGEGSEVGLGSGRNSQRAISRGSHRQAPSRKGSSMTASNPNLAASSHLVSSLTRGQHSSSITASPKLSKYSPSGSPHPGLPPSSTAGKPSLRLASSNRVCSMVSPLQMLDVERIAEVELGLTEDMMTENAARCIAEVGLLALNPGGRRLDKENHNATPVVVILAGNNKSGARAVAAGRHLRNHGVRVITCVLGLEREEEMLEGLRRQLQVARNIGGRVVRWPDLATTLKSFDAPAELIIDGLLGMHVAFEDLRNDDQLTAYELIAWANASKAQILAVDVPTGVDASTGEISMLEDQKLLVRARFIVAMGAPKSGLLNAMSSGQGHAWQLFVADIGISSAVTYDLEINAGNMGKGTDKLYITHSEWASEDAFSASAGAGVSKSKANGSSFRRLPFNFCAFSLQPFSHPVCTPDGTIFGLTNILPWLKKHGTNPVNGAPLKRSELIKLNFAKNEEDEYVDPVTFKVFTDNSHIVALRNTGNVFAYDTIERLNIKPKMWKDLVNDEDFSRKDIITLQDPHNVAARDLSSFKHLQEGVSTLTPEQEKERSQKVNERILGSSIPPLKVNEERQKARSEQADPSRNLTLGQNKALTKSSNGTAARSNTAAHTSRTVPYNAAQHTTGKAAASFTSTGLTPHTSGERALLTDEEYMLKPRRVKEKGYARIETNLGELNMELQTEYAPKAVWNFVQLAKKGYYRNVAFHRNIRNFMIQGGDPTGTGRGGSSIWNKNFNDEIDGPLTHDTRGVVSMANKGKNTNSSQFFITYRPAKHLDRKHTIFGRIIGGGDILSRLENSSVDSSDRPTGELTMLDVVVVVDPFEEFQKKKLEKDEAEQARLEVQRKGGTEDEKLTWTGKRVRGSDGVGGGAGEVASVGKYLKQNVMDADRPAARGVAGKGENLQKDEIVGEWDDGPGASSSMPPPPSKKMKSGFGNFDNW